MQMRWAHRMSTSSLPAYMLMHSLRLLPNSHTRLGPEVLAKHQPIVRIEVPAQYYYTQCSLRGPNHSTMTAPHRSESGSSKLVSPAASAALIAGSAWRMLLNCPGVSARPLLPGFSSPSLCAGPPQVMHGAQCSKEGDVYSMDGPQLSI